MSQAEHPTWRVSVVIPTIGRPELSEAVTSVLEQTDYLEEVVIGADTDEELTLPDDPRVRVVRTGPRAGGNVARMAAIRATTGNIIALLDDDDLWTPTKLQEQLDEVRQRVTADLWLSSTQMLEPNGRAWPARELQPQERIPHYLFRKNRLVGGQGAMHTSTLVFPRALIDQVPLDESLRFHQDTDWLIRLDAAMPDLEVLQVVRPLVEMRAGDGSVSRGISPLGSLDWAKRSMQHLDRRTRGDFLVTVTYFQACRHRDLPAALRVLKEAFLWGRPGVKTLPALAILPLKVATGLRLS